MKGRDDEHVGPLDLKLGMRVERRVKRRSSSDGRTISASGWEKRRITRMKRMVGMLCIMGKMKMMRKVRVLIASLGSDSPPLIFNSSR